MALKAELDCRRPFKSLQHAAVNTKAPPTSVLIRVPGDIVQSLPEAVASSAAIPKPISPVSMSVDESSQERASLSDDVLQAWGGQPDEPLYPKARLRLQGSCEWKTFLRSLAGQNIIMEGVGVIAYGS